MAPSMSNSPAGNTTPNTIDIGSRRNNFSSVRVSLTKLA